MPSDSSSYFRPISRRGDAILERIVPLRTESPADRLSATWPIAQFERKVIGERIGDKIAACHPVLQEVCSRAQGGRKPPVRRARTAPGALAVKLSDLVGRRGMVLFRSDDDTLDAMRAAVHKVIHVDMDGAP